LYGLLSLRQQSRWRVEFLRQLPPDIFVPRPAVDSGVIAMEPRPRPELPVFDEAVLDRVLASGFSQRRKMLRNLLPPHPAMPWEEMAAALGVLVTARAQELTLRQWVKLANIYDSHALKGNPQRGEEIFDVVNDRNEVIRQEMRRVVHVEGLWHRAVHLFVRNPAGDIFLQKRSHLKDSKPEKWDSSASGHLDSGEDYLTSAVRELEEELGIKTTASRLTLLGTVTARPGTGWEFVELFLTDWDGRLHWPASEIETGQWFSVEEIDAWTAARPEDFADGFLECWRLWRAGKTQEGSATG
ncbi:MAG: NUDIX domain-containing protein, partial [Verrucomicrobiaceae bacterium]